jgi:antitoxin component YwqK of YwqJK toxin-antitoxin module
MRLLIFFSLSLTVAFAQKPVNEFDEQGRRHGYWSKNFQGTDQIRYSGQFNHGKEIDTFNYYTLSQGKSVLSAVKVFRPDTDVAEVSFYTSTGGLISKGQMKGKTYTGTWVYYHKNSDQVMILENYNTNGVLDGEKKVYYKNGTLAEDSTYKNGKLQGKVSWYAEDGQLFKMLTYEQDVLSGPGEYFEPGGKIASKGLYKDNKKWGKWTYYKNGKAYKEINHSTNVVTKLE